MDNNWYSTDTSGWYSPLQKQETSEPDRELQVTAKAKKSHSGFWWTISILAIAALIIASSLYFGSKVSEASQIIQFGGMPDVADSSESEAEPRIAIPDMPAVDDYDDADESDEMPDNAADFFESFYTKVTTELADINIERAVTPIDYSLKIIPNSGEPMNLVELYKACSPSVVAISGYIDGKSGYYWGTGFIISEDGLIVTNTHVIDECDRAIVTLADNTEYEAKLVGADSISDIAVLKIEAAGLPMVEIGDSRRLDVGQDVVAIGNPLGETFKFTLTNGVVSAIDRGISYNGHTMTLIQTNTALNEGNSGGPLFNMYGQVVGVTNMKMMSSYSSIEGIGFAIPSYTFKSIVNSILKDGEVRGRPSIGITVGAIPESAAEMYELPEGLYISEVTKGSDAEAQGILPGDVLTHVNGTAVKTTDEVAAIKNEFGVGDALILTIFRNGETMDISVKLIDTNDLYK